MKSIFQKHFDLLIRESKLSENHLHVTGGKLLSTRDNRRCETTVTDQALIDSVACSPLADKPSTASLQ